MTPYAFKQLVISETPISIVKTHIFGVDVPWLFSPRNPDAPQCSYADFQKTVADEVGTAASEVALVGSSVFGFSTSPREEKTLRPFTALSDLDLVIVSPRLFRDVWDEFLAAYYAGHKWIMRRHNDDVFRRFFVLADTDYPATSTLLRGLNIRLDAMKRNIGLKTGINNTIKYRVYSEWTDVYPYYSRGVAKLKHRWSSV